ncbi:hypothetical protein FHW03_004748 [Ochrobactrum sp. RH2CCR150]|nr:hypothetical protein [Ochrobactrum sp. RH2CCR150]
MLLSHHVNQFDAGKSDPGGLFGFEKEHGSYPTFDAAMVLLVTISGLCGARSISARKDKAHLTSPKLCDKAVPFACGLTLLPIETLKQHGAEMQNRVVHRRMVNCNAAPGNYLLQITQAQVVSQIPSNTQKDDGLIEMAAFEHRTIQFLES